MAISLVKRYDNRANHSPIKPIDEIPVDPFNYNKRESFEVAGIGGSNVPVVFADLSDKKIISHNELKDIGYLYNEETDTWMMSDTAADIIYSGSSSLPFNCPQGLKSVYDYKFWQDLGLPKDSFPLLNIDEYLSKEYRPGELNFLSISLELLSSELIAKIRNDKKTVLVVETQNEHGMAEQRRFFFELINQNIKNPVIIKRNYENITAGELRIYASTDLGALLLDGFGDGVWLKFSGKLKEHSESSKYVKNFVKNESVNKLTNRTLFGILQATRTRISKTEYIACPSCGRTLFDLQETTEMIRRRTEHLKGVKIAVMGCIVNGPGEMADADYGYVGSGVDKITLYRAKNIVRRNIPAENAVDELINLIKEDGNWFEPAGLFNKAIIN